MTGYRVRDPHTEYLLTNVNSVFRVSGQCTEHILTNVYRVRGPYTESLFTNVKSRYNICIHSYIDALTEHIYSLYNANI